MDSTASLTAPCTAPELFAWVDDLARYPQWMSLVHHAVAVPADDGVPTWRVELRGRLGPLTRSKRLRMIRSECDAPRSVLFTRDEDDGRDHAEWSMRCALVELDEGGATATRLDVHLHYGGSLWGEGLLERALADHIERSSSRLVTLVRPTPPTGHPVGDRD